MIASNSFPLEFFGSNFGGLPAKLNEEVIPSGSAAAIPAIDVNLKLIYASFLHFLSVTLFFEKQKL